MVLGNRVIAQDDKGGALPTLYAAVADVPGNSYAGPSGFMEGRGAPELVVVRARPWTWRSRAGCGTCPSS